MMLLLDSSLPIFLFGLSLLSGNGDSLQKFRNRSNQKSNFRPTRLGLRGGYTTAAEQSDVHDRSNVFAALLWTRQFVERTRFGVPCKSTGTPELSLRRRCTQPWNATVACRNFFPWNIIYIVKLGTDWIYCGKTKLELPARGVIFWICRQL